MTDRLTVWNEVVGEEHKEICSDCDEVIMGRDRPESWEVITIPVVGRSVQVSKQLVCPACYGKGTRKRSLRSAIGIQKRGKKLILFHFILLKLTEMPFVVVQHWQAGTSVRSTSSYTILNGKRSDESLAAILNRHEATHTISSNTQSSSGVGMECV